MISILWSIIFHSRIVEVCFFLGTDIGGYIFFSRFQVLMWVLSTQKAGLLLCSQKVICPNQNKICQISNGRQISETKWKKLRFVILYEDSCNASKDEYFFDFLLLNQLTYYGQCFQSFRNQSGDLDCKSDDWFLYV